jgi:hypothetical protein
MAVRLNPLGRFRKTWTIAQHKYWWLRSPSDQKAFGHEVFQGGIDRDVPEDLQLESPCRGRVGRPYDEHSISVTHASGWQYVLLEIHGGRKVGTLVDVGEGLARASAKSVHEHGVSPAGKRVAPATALKKMAAYEKKHGIK